jgi:large subunit ribosomal protein L30
MSDELIRVRYVKSAIGYSRRQKDTVRSLGLRRIGDEAVHTSSPAIQGMIRAVGHLVDVVPLADARVVAADGETEVKPRRRPKS